VRVMKLLEAGSSERFVSDEIDRPIPGSGEFLIKVLVCGICGHDVLARDGKLTAKAGHILGHEISGVVVEVGSKELATWIGSRVALVQRRPCGECSDCLNHMPTHCRLGPGFYGDDIQGGNAEYIISDPRNTAKIPDSIDDSSAAVLSCAIGTGLRALKLASLKKDDVLLITGAGGGVGIHSVTLASLQGAKVIAITSTESKVNAIYSAGANKVLVNPTGHEIKSAAAELGRTRGVDAVLELTGSPTFPMSFRSIRPRGRVVIVGNTKPEDLSFSPGLMILKELQIVGSANADLQDLLEVISLVESGKIKPLVSNSYPLKDLNQAHRDLDNRIYPGRLVITL